ncbi:MAG TPA: fructose-bisphosphatase class II, partial [Acidimicrobiia bacterium]|nr:fructose-bisphosphatase class II [Acidimicrobiia bacterium]
DIAVDPVEGTSLVADDQPGGISIIGAAREGCMWDPIVSYYMDKLVVGRQCAGQVDLDAPMDETVKVIARCHGIRPEQVRVVILDRPRNRAHIDGIRRAGAEPVLIDQGDVGPAIRACMPDTGIHAVAGIGGTPEGVATRVQYLPSEERPWGGWLPNAPVKPGGSPRNTAPRGN